MIFCRNLHVLLTNNQSTMKKLLLILIVLIFAMCSKPKSRWELIEEQQKLEISKGIRKDTIFLGFTFGMTSTQVNNKFKKLLAEGNISENSKGEYEYIIPLDVPKNPKATFITRYFNNSLYSFRLNIESNTPVEAELIQLGMVKLYQKKYRSFIEVPSILDQKESDFIFIIGNQQININYPFYSTTATVDYKDFMMEKRKDIQDNKQQNDRENKLLKNL